MLAVTIAYIHAAVCNQHRTTVSLFRWSKQKWLFWRAGIHPAN